MKIQIENLKAQMQGRELNIYQRADALVEFNKLLDYVEELEQLTIPAIIGRCEQLVCCENCTHFDKQEKTCGESCVNWSAHNKAN